MVAVADNDGFCADGELKADGPDSRPVSSMAIVSLVLGIVALLASFLKEIGLAALCLGGHGVICSLLGGGSSSLEAAVGTRGRSWSSSAR